MKTNYRHIFLCSVLITISGLAFAQPSDTAKIKKNHITGKQWKQATLAPGILIATGFVAMTDNEIVDREEFYEGRNKWAPNFHTHADDYLQYAPIVAVYGLNAFGIKGEHDFANRTVLLIKSELLMMAMVLPLKELTNVPRPDSGAPNSFPSGHTAQAFVAATFLQKEYGKEHPMYAVLGYTVATGVGVMRVLNNRHWASDVLVGAGIGILSTNLAYLTHQNKWGHQTGRPKKVKKDVVLSPFYYKGSIGAGVGMVFH